MEKYTVQPSVFEDVLSGCGSVLAEMYERVFDQALKNTILPSVVEVIIFRSFGAAGRTLFVKQDLI